MSGVDGAADDEVAEGAAPLAYADFPPAAGALLQSLLTASFAPLCLRIGRDYRLQQCWGDPAMYGLEALSVGGDVRDAAPFLHNLDWDRPQTLPMVHTAEQRAAHVHMLPGPGHCLVVYVQASAELRQRQQLQQAANEVRLRNHDQRRLLARLIEARTELENRRRDAERSARVKSRFIARMSHEFRTPLTSVIGYANLLSDELPADEDSARHAGAIGRASRHLLSLVDNILEQARLEEGGMVAHPRAFELRRQISDLAAILAPLAAEKGLSFAAFVAPSVPEEVVMDDMRLRQVLLNLLGNAVKFTDTGFVQLDLDWRDGQLRAVVADSGPGIGKADAARIFRAFERAGEDTRKSGAGLGLSISQRLVDLMGGSIRLEPGADRGCRFVLTLPAPRAAPEVPAVDGGTATGGGAADGLLDRPSPRVLVAEDNEDIIVLVKMMLTRAGYDILLAANGEEAVQMALDKKPDVVLMDVNMPVLDGLKATHMLRRRGFTA
ncbi:MAG: ATP-binding protein, partial [Pseudomonadota bacterium]